MTAEEEEADDEDVPDFSALRLNTENAHLFMDPHGTAHSSPH